MRREGRIHGSYVRMSKHEPFEYKGAPRKPTNHSKVSGACLNNRVRCCYCHTAPVLKAMCKTKGKYKLKDLDVTRNYKLDEYAVTCPPSSHLVPSSAHFRNYYADAGENLDHDNYCSEYEDYDDNNEETLDEADNHRPSEVMFAVASFLRDMRAAHQFTADVATPDSNSEEETLDETLQEEFPSELNRQIATDSDCSWSGIDVSDTEHGGVDVDGWYLVG